MWQGSPLAASITGVPALCPLGCLLLAQQVGVDEVEKLIRADGQDVAFTVSACFVQEHHVEVGAGEVQELPELFYDANRQLVLPDAAHFVWGLPHQLNDGNMTQVQPAGGLSMEICIL